MAKVKKTVRAALAKTKPTPTLSIRPVGEALPAFPKLTADQLAALVDEAVDVVATRVRAAGLLRQEAADHLFRHVYLNSVRLALDPKAPVPPAAVVLGVRAGKSLVLSPYELRRYVRVGAMNHHLRSELWVGLPFDTKLELVRLLNDAESFGDFEAAVLYAATAHVGAKALRDFVNARLPESEDGGRPRGLTPKGARTLATTAEQLDDPELQARLAERIARMEDSGDRDALLEDLETAAKNIAKVVAAARARVRKARG